MRPYRPKQSAIATVCSWNKNWKKPPRNCLNLLKNFWAWYDKNYHGALSNKKFEQKILFYFLGKWNCRLLISLCLCFLPCLVEQSSPDWQLFLSLSYHNAVTFPRSFLVVHRANIHTKTFRRNIVRRRSKNLCLSNSDQQVAHFKWWNWNPVTRK